jgi:hypothetical protein
MSAGTAGTALTTTPDVDRPRSSPPREQESRLSSGLGTGAKWRRPGTCLLRRGQLNLGGFDGAGRGAFDGSRVADRATHTAGRDGDMAGHRRGGRGRRGSASRPLAWGVLDVRAPCARRSSRPDAAQLAGSGLLRRLRRGSGWSRRLAAHGRPARRRRPGPASAGPRQSDDAHPALVRVAQTPERRVGDI